MLRPMASRRRTTSEQGDRVLREARGDDRPVDGPVRLLRTDVVTDTEEEYRACREAAALMDFTMLRKVSLDGPGALALVNSIVTRDVSKLTPGRIAYGALATRTGRWSTTARR